MGLLGMLKSRNRQLLHFIMENPCEDASARVTKKMVKKATVSRNAAMELLSELFSLLPKGVVVVVLLDSMSCLSREAPKGDVFVDFLIQLMKDFPQLKIELLVTDCLPSSKVRHVCHLLGFLMTWTVGGWASTPCRWQNGT